VSGPTIGVFALQGDVREHLRVLESLGADATPVRRPAELERVDGLVLPGGESTTMYKLAVAFDLLEPLRDRVKHGMPAYGSCAGMIMLADRILDAPEDQQTIGGIDMAVRRNAFGRQVDSFEGEIELSGVGGGPIEAVFIRAPWVESVGADVEVLSRLGTHVHSLATGEGPGEVASRIVAVRQGALLATSFHPELTGDARVHELFLKMVRERS
jgi:pyridoxal 5'-phosphate synthase pdxT subunit